MNEIKLNTDMLHAAIAYTKQSGERPSLRVFPVQVHGKMPLISARDGGHGCKDGTTDRAKIEAWYSRTPNANIGLPTGEVNGIVVIDVDNKPEEGKYGNESLRSLEKTLGNLPDTWECLTPSGGKHLYFNYPRGMDIRCSAGKLADWIDIRGNGGYVVAPPSTLTNGRSYQWEASSVPKDIPLAELPQTWLEAIVKAGGQNQEGTEKFVMPDSVERGSRNDTMFKYTCRLREQGILPTEIRRRMSAVNDKNFHPPLSDQELEQIFNSALRYPDGEIRKQMEEYGAIQALDRSKTVSKKTDYLSLLMELHPDNSNRYKQSDLGDGYLFADIFRDRILYLPERKSWYTYNGKFWEQDVESKKTMQLCKDLANALMNYATRLDNDKLRSSYIKHVQQWQSFRKRETILKDASSVNIAFMEDFDNDNWIFNCQNGTLNLATGAFKPHDPDDRLMKISGVKYNPDACCPRWEQFISEIMMGDDEKKIFLQKALGYTLTGASDQECFFILYGATTRNGKGTLMESFRKIMGDYGGIANPETISRLKSKDGAKASPDLACLNGTRFVNISEPEKNMQLSAALIKTLTGNDTIRVRGLNENGFYMKPHFKIFINSNHLPGVDDPTVFSSDRIKVVPFERHFSQEERDTSLKGTFAKSESLSGIFNWCLQGLKLYREEGLKMPQSVIDATEEYKHDSDKVSRFMEDEMEKDPREEVVCSEAYSRYTQWCDKNGQYAESNTKFTQNLKAYAVIDRKRPRYGGEKTSVILGYRMKTRYS